MRRALLFLASVLLLNIPLQAQDKDSLYTSRREEPAKKNWTERISVGGNFGLSFGSYTYVELAPLIGYRITEKFMAGGGVTYIYSRYRNNYNQVNSNSVYGGRTFARYTVHPNVAPHVEYEALNVPDYQLVGGDITEKRRWIGNALVGANFLVPLGRRSTFGITVLYNVNYENNKRYSIYGSPWVLRMGVML